MFDAREYIEKLNILDIEYYSKDGVLTFEITVKNILGGKHTFKATISQLKEWKKFEKLFIKYTWKRPENIDKRIREEALSEIVRTFMQIGRKSENFIRNTKEKFADALITGFKKGRWTDSFEEFIMTTAYAGFKGEDGRYYTTFEAAIRIYKEAGINRKELLNSKDQKDLIDLLRQIGAKKIYYYGRVKGQEVRKLAFILPADFKPVQTLDIFDSFLIELKNDKEKEKRK